MTPRHFRTFIFAAAICAPALCIAARQSDAPNAAHRSSGTTALDYQYYKTKIEPIFLKKRGEHARCYACHSQNQSIFHLQRLVPGNTNWTEDQSRLNFQSVSHLVSPGDIASTILLSHPLAPEVGGDSFHSGGRQFESKDDPDWKTIAEWVRMGKREN